MWIGFVAIPLSMISPLLCTSSRNPGGAQDWPNREINKLCSPQQTKAIVHNKQGKLYTTNKGNCTHNKQRQLRMIYLDLTIIH